MIAKVNGVDIHQSDLALAEEDIGQNMPVKDEAGRRDYLINYLADMILLSKAAEAKKIPDTADFKRRAAYLAQQGADGDHAAGRGEAGDHRRQPAQGL